MPDSANETERLRARVVELERALGEQRLPSAEAQDAQSFRAVVENSRDLVAMAGLDQQLFYLNAAGRELIGVDDNADVSTLTLADLVPVDGLDQFRNIEIPAVLERGLWRGENTLALRGSGATIPVLTRSFLIRPHPAGPPSAIATIKHNLADRVRTEEALHRRVELERLVASISQGFIHCGADAMEFQIEVTLELLGSFVGAERSVLMQVGEGGNTFHISHEWCAAGAAPLRDHIPSLTASKYPWGQRRLMGGDVICIDSAEELPTEAAAEYRLLATIGICALLLVPLVSESHTVGCIGFNRNDSERSWAVADITLLRTVADIIANALARQRMERELRASEQKFASIFAASPDAVSVTSVADGRLIEVNPAFEAVTGHSREEVIGRSAIETGIWVVAEDRSRLLRELRRQGKVTDFEARFRRRSGAEFDSLVSAFPVQMDERECVVVITRDISERKSMETALRESEYVLRAIVENIPDAVWMKDRAGRIIVGNQALASFFSKRNMNEVIGRTVAELAAPEQIERLQRDDAIVSRTRSQLTTEERFELRGETRWFETVKAPVLDAAGNLVGTTGISHNVTQRKLVEQAMRQSEARFRQFAEDLPFFIWMATVDRSRLLFVNKSYEHIFGRSIEALREHPSDWFSAVHPEDRAGIPLLKDFAAQRGLFINEFRIVRSDGDVRWLRNHVIPLENEKGEIYLHAGISEDVTERKAAEAEVLRFNSVLEERVFDRTAALQASLSELESFSYSVSHDLSTPLRGINGFSHLLLADYSDLMDETAKGYLKRICSASERMGLLIDDLLTLAKLSRVKIQPISINLSQMAAEILADFAFQEPLRQVRTRIAPNIEVNGDPTLLRLLLENLLANAWKFTSQRADASIELGTIDAESRRAIFVRDNGTGFDNAFLAKLYQPFQRLHGVEEFPGSGIGLATVKRIAERHGGSVWADGKIGEGASFYFTLP